MPHLFRGLAALTFLLAPASPLVAQFPATALNAGKQATALLEVEDDEGGTGSAFCVDSSGLFVTNAYVIETGSKFRLVINPGRPGQASYPAKVIRVDKKSDIALLQAEGAKGITTLELGRDDDLGETQEVVAFGYPFAKALGKGMDSPSISVTTGRITSLPMPDGKLARIELDASLNPGNSGGPVLDKGGRVIGVVQGGVRGAMINFAIPVGRLSEVLSSPVVLLDPADLSYKTRDLPADWTVRVIPARLAADADVDLVLQVDSGAPRTFPAKPSGRGDGVYVARVTPASGPRSDHEPTLGIIATFRSGLVEGKIADRPIKFAGAGMSLGGLRVIRHTPTPVTVLFDGTEVAGTPAGLDAVQVDLGGATILVDLGRAERVEFLSTPPGLLTLRCTTRVRRAKAEVASVDRTFELRQAPGSKEVPGALAGGPSTIRPPELASDRVELKLPGTVTDIAAGAGGRILLLTMKDVKKLAIFDVNAARVISLLPLPSDDVLVAAGATKFVIVSPGQAVIQRWDLATLERERTGQITFNNGMISAIVMGSRSKGPIMAYVMAQAGKDYKATGFGFIDLETLRPITGFRQSTFSMNNRQAVNPAQEAAGLISTPIGASNSRVQLRASSGGELFSAWAVQQSPAGLLSFAWKDKQTVEFRHEHDDAGFTAPGPDGKTMYTGTMGLINDQLKLVGGSLAKNRAYMPSTAPNYFVGLEGKRASLFVVGSDVPLVVLGLLDELEVPPRPAARRTRSPTNASSSSPRRTFWSRSPPART